MSTLTAGERVESGELIGDHEWHWHVEVDSQDPTDATLIWYEEMYFHTEVRHLALIDPEDSTELRAGVLHALQVELLRLLKVDEVYVEQADTDNPTLEITVPLKVEPPTMERLAEVVWPPVATLTNIMDPGTFNAEYVMGNVARQVEEVKP